MPPVAEKRRKPLKIGDGMIWVLIVVATLWVFFPFYWAITTSLKEHLAIVSQPGFIPWLQFRPTLLNWEPEFVNHGPEIISGLTNRGDTSIGGMNIPCDL